MTTTKLRAGDIIHFLRSGIIYRISDSPHAASEVSQRGQSLTITLAIIAASADRNGAHSWLLLVDDLDGQIRRWGSVVFGRGVGDGITAYEPGSTEEDVAFSERRSAAWAVADPLVRAEAFRALRAEFGSPTTSTTLRTEGPR